MKTPLQAKHLDLPLEIKQVNDDGSFTGDLSVYDFIDYGGDVTQKGCFTKTLQESGGKIPMLAFHDMSRPIGVMELTDGESSLEAKGYLNMDLPDAKQVLSTMRFNMRHGIKTGLSMGYITVKDAIKSGIRFLQEVKLLEGSVVTLAQNVMCAVTEVKSASTSPERKDFAAELEETQVYDLFYQVCSALYSELANSVYMADEQAAAEDGVKKALADAENAFLDFVNRYFSLKSTENTAEYMNFPETRVAQKMLMDLETRVKALLAKSGATSTEAGADDAGAATQPNEPGDSHSNELTAEQKAVVRNFVKESFNGNSRTSNA